MARRAPHPSPDEASILALAALAFLAEDGPRLGRFLALTGIGPDQLRGAADAPETLLAVLDHLRTDDSLLLVFTSSKGIPPERVGEARTALARLLGAEDIA